MKSEIAGMAKIYKCPCCAAKTLSSRAGFELCPVCYWEDDGQDDEDADVARGGPNGSLTLTEARNNYLVCGACDTKFLRNIRPAEPEELEQ